MSTPAGWYTDPDAAGQERYWDGAQWSAQRRPTAAAAATAPTAPVMTHAAPVKKSHTARNILLAIVALLVLLVGGCTAIVIVAASNVDDEPATSTDGVPRDGKFEFDVQSLECGVPKVGKGFLAEEARGQFCLLTLGVANIGDEAQTFDYSSQLALNADGTEFSADGDATISLDKADTFFEEINPGNDLEAVVVFDIPEDEVITQLELHDSLFSDGVTVDAP